MRSFAILPLRRRPDIRSFSCVLSLSVLSACGGGGGSSSTPAPPPPPVNVAPTAEAGDDQAVESGGEVSLDGSASIDSDGSITSFAWEQTDGVEVELVAADQAAISFIAPELTNDGELVFMLTVIDDDGASASDSVSISVAARVEPVLASISGRILPSPSQKLDGDTNDPFNPVIPNNDPASPQALTNPATLGGYVNEPGSGTEGRSLVSGDREDFFSVELLEGQTIGLLVAEFQDADADLYLYTPDFQLVDFSIETGQQEAIVVPADGNYLVNVSVFSGATNYTLAIGSALVAASVPNYRDVVPGQ
ncbi:MAG: PKD domain-containing protein, partial [Pseudomonadota bacterium]